MSLFLVERYAPGPTERLVDSVTRVALAADEASQVGRGVRHLWSAHIPADETCLCLFEAPDREAVAELNERAAFPFDRIVEVVAVAPDRARGGRGHDEEMRR
jgi:hypothetical protein